VYVLLILSGSKKKIAAMAGSERAGFIPARKALNIGSNALVTY
jgi:hypothetical protein